MRSFMQRSEHRRLLRCCSLDECSSVASFEQPAEDLHQAGMVVLRSPEIDEVPIRSAES